MERAVLFPPLSAARRAVVARAAYVVPADRYRSVVFDHALGAAALAIRGCTSGGASGSHGSSRKPLQAVADDAHRRPRKIHQEVVVEPVATIGEESGAILADFLAMGAGRVSGAASVQQPFNDIAVRRRPFRDANARQPSADVEVDATSSSAGSGAESGIARPGRERRLVTAALRPGEALTKAQSDIPSRPFMSSLVQPRSPGLVPPLFAAGYAEYKASVDEAADAALESQEAGIESGIDNDSAATATSSADSLRTMRLQVRPWHRSALNQMLCKNVLFHFMQSRRDAQSLTPTQQPLLLFEARRAQQHCEAGEVLGLVQFLAETELHIQFGPERAAREPGQQVPRDIFQRLRAERQQLAKGWDVAFRRVEEDALVRAFLDGQLSWPNVQDLLASAPVEVPSKRA